MMDTTRSRNADAEPLVSADRLSKVFTLKREGIFAPPPTVKAVDDVSFSIAPGTTFGLVGESGSGKTTIAKMLLRLQAPSSGRLALDGRDIFELTRAEERRFRKSVQTVLQDPYGALSPRMRVGNIVSEPLRALGGVQPAEIAERARASLAEVGLRAEHFDRYPHEFSGGQRQRIAIARALTVDPRLMVLDEPVSALDVSVRAQILKLFRELQQRKNLTYLFIGHDLAVVRYLSSSVGVMYFGRMVEIGDASHVLGDPLHPYTMKLVAAAKGDAPLGQSRAGVLPNPLKPPSGCQFRTRCAFADSLCRTLAPELRSFAPRHQAACHHVESIRDGTKTRTGPLLDA